MKYTINTSKAKKAFERLTNIEKDKIEILEYFKTAVENFPTEGENKKCLDAILHAEVNTIMFCDTYKDGEVDEEDSKGSEGAEVWNDIREMFKIAVNGYKTNNFYAFGNAIEVILSIIYEVVKYAC